MEKMRKSELEVIRYEKMRHLHVFLVSIMSRKMHEHSNFEINMILKGSARIRCPEKEIQAQKGSVLLFSPYEPHEIVSDNTEPVQILSVQISNHFCGEYFPRLHNVEFAENSLDNLLTPDKLELIRELLLRLAVRFLLEKASFQLACVSAASLLLYRLLCFVPYTVMNDQEYMVRKRRTDRIRRITDYVDRHYKEHILLPELAAMEGLTPTYLSHFFHDTFNMTFQEYLSRLRLEKALILMKDPSLYLVDVCMECGFSDNKYLNRMFRKEFGCSASEYRKKKIAPDEKETREPNFYSEYLYPQSDSIAILKQYTGEKTFDRLCD